MKVADSHTRAIVNEKRDAIRQRNPAVRFWVQSSSTACYHHALQAFQQKIEDNGQHARGCNCKKSRCKKGYCECFQVIGLIRHAENGVLTCMVSQAGVPCGEACRCCGCENPHGYVVGTPHDDDDDDGIARARAALPLPVTPSTLYVVELLVVCCHISSNHPQDVVQGVEQAPPHSLALLRLAPLPTQPPCGC